MCLPKDDPRIVTVTREPVDTITEGVGVCVNPRIILG